MCSFARPTRLPAARITARRAADRGPVEHLAQPLDLWRQIARMIADEEAVIMGDVRVDDLADHVVVEDT